MYHISQRPSTLDEVVGHRTVISSLKGVLESKDIPHAFLLLGPSGTGKTTLGRIIAKEVGCIDGEVYEVNMADTRGIDFMRDITSQARYKPLKGTSKVYIFDEFFRATPDAQNLLLKTLEDCPKHTYFILCSTNPEKILKTIQTRCHTYVLNTLKDKEIKKLLEKVCKVEKLEVNEDIIDLIVLQAEGTPRTALVLLHQLKDMEDADACELVLTDFNQEGEIIELCRILVKRGGGKWEDIIKIFKSLNSVEPETIRISIVNYLSACVTRAKGPSDLAKFSDMMEYFVSPVAYSSGRAELVFGLARCYLLTA